MPFLSCPGSSGARPERYEGSPHPS
jgi:hypothetical protein